MLSWFFYYWAQSFITTIKSCAYHSIEENFVFGVFTISSYYLKQGQLLRPCSIGMGTSYVGEGLMVVIVRVVKGTPGAAMVWSNVGSQLILGLEGLGAGTAVHFV